MNGERNNNRPHDTLLPGWRWVKLGEVAKEFVNGGTPSTNIPEYWDGNIPWITGADVTDFWVSGGRKFITEDGLKNSVTHLVPRNTVLVVTRTGVGKVGIAANDLCFSQDITGVICSKEIYPEYLVWYIFSERNNLTNIQRGATIKGLTRNDIESLQIPLPPLEEQKSISLRIQESLQEVKHARTACEKQLEAARALPTAYLREVFESEEAKKWERKRLGEVCEFLDSMRIPVNDGERQKRIAGKKQTELYPYYGANGQVGWIDNFLFDEELVLLAEDGGFFGSFEKPIAYRVGGKCWVNNHAHVLRTNREIIDVDWLYFSLAIRPDIMCFVSGTTRPKLNQEQASKIPIPLPSILIQQRIAADLKGKMAEVENLESTIQNQQSALNALPQAILRQAFNGEL
ncbi:MAG: restriction endonuclease subunit S [Thermodesulfobacteriota bacterium]|nr:restriction endonuclease subunit S [Thermodesulfobacteriota bacterium]